MTVRQRVEGCRCCVLGGGWEGDSYFGSCADYVGKANDRDTGISNIPSEGILDDRQVESLQMLFSGAVSVTDEDGATTGYCSYFNEIIIIIVDNIAC